MYDVAANIMNNSSNLESWKYHRFNKNANAYHTYDRQLL